MMGNNVCFVFGAGEYFEQPPAVGLGDYVIAADGGYEYLKRNNIAADLVVGDFDSCELAADDAVNAVVLPCEKDNTDMAEAVKIGLDKGFRIFYIFGGVGGRVEHTLANIQCIADIAAKGGRGFLFGKDTVITAVKDGCVCFDSDAAGYVSAFAHSDIAYGVYEKGLKYVLNDAALYNTNPIGVSNEFIGLDSSISVASGTLIIVYSKDVREVGL